MTSRLSIILAASGILLAGCQRTSVADQDARDRENPAIRHALEREQSGDLDGAIQAYEDVLQDSPKLVSAHFHLALLLQDYRKDYMGAIYHYRQYQRLRPDSEKEKDLLKDRIRVCQQLLVVQLLNTGDVAISRKQLELVAEIDRLNKRLSLAEGEKSGLMEQKEAVERQLAEQKSDNERLRRLLDRALPGSEESHPRSVLPRLDPTGSALSPRATTSTLPPRSSSADPAPAPVLKPAETAGVSDPDPATAHVPAEPVTAASRTYAVQPGDNIYRIAERVYGDPMLWKKIRDANKDRLGPDNQVRVGQQLLIP